MRGEAGGGACYAITGEAAVGAEKERRLGKGSMVLSEEGRGRRGSRSGKAMIRCGQSHVTGTRGGVGKIL